ncbi:hypothetical protein [Joostella sp.]|uniref:hypothetical protein n=1 Tax=Joostella sp. TaxID=2231138 RepID=UPI003A925404
MSLNPLNNHIKKTLEERKINPSKDAWERLESKLNTDGNSKRKNIAMVYWVAAVFVVILVSSIYLINSSNQDIHLEVVKQNVQDPIEEPIKKNPEILNEQIIEASNSMATKKSVSDELNENKASQSKKAIEYVEDGTSVLVAERKKETIESDKINDVASKIIELKEGTSVTDEEINALLLEAQKSIYNEKMHNKRPDSLSAMALLDEVETELDQSFKEKVFEVIKERLMRVKSAVADRNQ